MAWYEDIEGLISATGEARNAYVRRHIRSVSGASVRSSSDGVMDEDEADRTPYSAGSVVMSNERPQSQPRQSGGRFPSDVQIDRHLNAPLSPSSGESSGERDLLAAAGSLPDGGHFAGAGNNRFYSDQDVDSNPTPNQSRPTSYIAGGAHRFPIDGYDRYQEKFMTSSDSFNRNQQIQQAPIENRVTIETPKEIPTSTLFVAGLGSTAAQDHAEPRQRNRGESASTAFTNSNVTNMTHSTVPTSVDEDAESDDDIESVKPSGRSFRSEMSSLPTSTRNSIDVPKRPSAQTKNSVSTIDLKVPGYYPPQQATA